MLCMRNIQEQRQSQKLHKQNNDFRRGRRKRRVGKQTDQQTDRQVDRWVADGQTDTVGNISNIPLSFTFGNLVDDGKCSHTRQNRYNVKGIPGNRPACTNVHVTAHVCLSQLQQILV